MNHRHRKLLGAVFAHPISANLDGREVEHLLGELGAELHHTRNGRLGAKLNGHSISLHTNSHSLAKEEVVQLRRFLEACDITPETAAPGSG
jgi:hypothetical protein